MRYLCHACKAINLIALNQASVRSWVDNRFLPPHELFTFCGTCQHQMVLNTLASTIRDLNKEEVKRMGDDPEYMKARADRVEYLCRIRRRGIG